MQWLQNIKENTGMGVGMLCFVSIVASAVFICDCILDGIVKNCIGATEQSKGKDHGER